MAATDIWFPFYIGDYLADTMHLNTQQHGAYLLLLLSYYKNRGPIADNDTILAVITRMTLSDWMESRSALEKFFKIEAGYWTHKRADAEIFKRQSLQDARIKGAAITNAKLHGTLSDTLSVTPSDAGALRSRVGKPQSQSQSQSERHSEPYPNNGLSPFGVQISEWFGRRESTQWSAKELRALKQVELLKTHPDDILLMSEYYHSESKIKRRDIATLLNNWNGELDRAKDWKRAPHEYENLGNGTNGTHGKINSLNPAADRRNAGTIGGTDYGAAGRRKIEKQKMERLAAEQAVNGHHPPTA